MEAKTGMNVKCTCGTTIYIRAEESGATCCDCGKEVVRN